jgi:hypothetical protein
MAAAIVQFISKTPRASLKAYFDEKPHPVAQLVDWDDEKADPVKPLLKAEGY